MLPSIVGGTVPRGRLFRNLVNSLSFVSLYRPYVYLFVQPVLFPRRMSDRGDVVDANRLIG